MSNHSPGYLLALTHVNYVGNADGKDRNPLKTNMDSVVLWHKIFRKFIEYMEKISIL